MNIKPEKQTRIININKTPILMNTTSHKPARLLHRISLSGLLAVTLAAASPTTADAAIIANFSGGNGVEEVDQFLGIAGNGWQGAWVRRFNTGVNTDQITVFTPSTSGYAPLVNGQNYLRIRFRKGTTATETAGASVTRQYGNYDDIALNDVHTISFYLRVDSSLSLFNKLTIADATPSVTPYNNATVRWLADVSDTSTWQFLNNTQDGRVDSGITVTQGNVYHFQITVNPFDNQYSVKLDDITANLSYSSTSPLNFLAKSGNVTGTLFFSAIPVLNPLQTTQVDFSVSNISIGAIPEPNTAAMIGVGAAILLWMSKRRAVSRATR